MKEKVLTLIRTILILVLVALVGIMMVQIQKLQGTARVINYAGLVRGATQREIKLEVTGYRDDELVKYLDDILKGLKYGEGEYHLTSLADEDYQNKLDTQMDYWEKLKTEIKEVREQGYENTDIVEMSETYFHMADETVSAAEIYSVRTAHAIRLLEILSIIDMTGLVLMIICQTITVVKMKKANKELETRAYLDLQTGLPNRSRCEELISVSESINEPTAFIMMDLNNLKHVNDTYGHTVGNQLISNFARILRSVIPAKDFVGRYGGDEFITIISQTTREEIEEIIKMLHREIETFNDTINKIEISFAYGWVISSDYMHCSMKTLFDQADKNMYENKQNVKKAKKL